MMFRKLGVWEIYPWFLKQVWMESRHSGPMLEESKLRQIGKPIKINHPPNLIPLPITHPLPTPFIHISHQPPGFLAPAPETLRYGVPLHSGDVVACLPEWFGREGQATSERGHFADYLRLGCQGSTCRRMLGWKCPEKLHS